MPVIDICNDALGQIGASRIADITDGSPNANWCIIFYPRIRRALLRMHNWNFAEDRVELALDATAPAFEFSHAFTLPVNLLKIREYNGVFVTPPGAITTISPMYWMRYTGYYKIEGRRLLTNDSQALIVYVKDVEDVTQWDSLFEETVTTWLAAKLASAINKDPAKGDALFTRAMSFLLPFASAVDGQEGTVIPYQVDDLIWGR